MDAPDSDRAQLYKALEQFSTINRLATPCHRLLRYYFLSQMKRDRRRKWSLLDVGAGAGDLAIWMVRRCGRLEIDIDITCLDHDPRVVEFAKRNCQPYSNVHVVQGDVLALSESNERWDFVFCNHILHHLTDDQIVTALAAIRHVCRRQYVMSDIRRSRFAYLAFTALAALLWRNSFAFDDGRSSVRKAFTRQEFLALTDAAGLSGEASVERWFSEHLAIVGGNGQRR